MVCGQLTGFYFLSLFKMSPTTQLPLQPPPRPPNEVINPWFIFKISAVGAENF